jgi:hypothetical protein
MSFWATARRLAILLIASALISAGSADARAPRHAPAVSQPDEAQLTSIDTTPTRAGTKSTRQRTPKTEPGRKGRRRSAAMEPTASVSTTEALALTTAG